MRLVIISGSFEASRHRHILLYRIWQRLLLLAIVAAIVLVAAGEAAAQSGWYHCDIQIGPSTYKCRPVSRDWLCKSAGIISFCSSVRGRAAVSSSDSRGAGDSSKDVNNVGGFINPGDIVGAVGGQRGQTSVTQTDDRARPPGEREDRICTKGNLKVRASPSLEAEIIGYLRSGVSLRRISRRGAWLEIDYRGRSGWIGAAYASESDDCGDAAGDQPSAAREMEGRVCTTGKLKVRAEPSLEAEIIGYLRSGVTLRLLSRFGSWFEIDYRGASGWVGAGFASQDGDCG